MFFFEAYRHAAQNCTVLMFPQGHNSAIILHKVLPNQQFIERFGQFGKGLDIFAVEVEKAHQLSDLANCGIIFSCQMLYSCYGPVVHSVSLGTD